MRLWHQELIKHIPNNQLKGQHRECCALRGNGWGVKHSTVNYVFEYNPYLLIMYHKLIIKEITNRNDKGIMNYNVNKIWIDDYYRGKKSERWDTNKFYGSEKDLKHYNKYKIIYKEHNQEYLLECLNNLKEKNIIINF